MRVRVLFLEPGLVRVWVGVCNAVVGVLVHGMLVLVRMDVYAISIVLAHPAPFVGRLLCGNGIYRQRYPTTAAWCFKHPQRVISETTSSRKKPKTAPEKNYRIARLSLA